MGVIRGSLLSAVCGNGLTVSVEVKWRRTDHSWGMGSAFTSPLAHSQSTCVAGCVDLTLFCSVSVHGALCRSEDDSTPDEEEYERELKEMVRTARLHVYDGACSPVTCPCVPLHVVITERTGLKT